MILNGAWMLADCRLQKVEQETRHLHHYLDETDECFFIGEYTSGRNYEFSQINQLIYNLKKKPSLQHTNPSAYKYKLLDISVVSNCLKRILKKEHLNSVLTIVPIPPSKTRSHPEHDDRMWRICAGLIEGLESPDLIELIQSKENVAATHQEEHKPPPKELIRNYEIVAHPGYLPRKYVVLVDDMLTTGTHFKACKNLVLQAYPNVNVVGIFVSRRVFPPIFD